MSSAKARNTRLPERTYREIPLCQAQTTDVPLARSSSLPEATFTSAHWVDLPDWLGPSRKQGGEKLYIAARESETLLELNIGSHSLVVRWQRLYGALNFQDKLKAILEGEPPYDIYLRWKPLHRQPIGWEPDINDGMRLNIGPFVMTGVLRAKFTINWNRDRGTNPDSSDRINDRHHTRAEKKAARKDPILPT